MAAAEQNLVRALTQHDKVRRSTDIPLFYGRKDQDTISPHQLLERINRAKRVANWADDERVCDEFYLCLRKSAISWSNTLDNIPGFNKNSWADVQREFLAAYATKFTARTVCTSFHDLRQKSDETVQDFYNRVSEVFRDAFLVKPDHVTVHDGTDAERFALTVVQAQALMKRGIDNMQLLVMNTMFIGGLRPDIRDKVLETGPTRIQEAVKLAREVEIIFRDGRDKPAKGAYISAVHTADDPALSAEDVDLLDIDYDDVAHVKRINAIRRKMNKPPLKYRIRPGSRPPAPSSQNPAAECWFCKTPGHFQKDCRKRKTAGAPMIDAAGRPYASSSGSPQQRSAWSGAVHAVNPSGYGMPSMQCSYPQQHLNY
jgi:hypothetical protein